MKIIQSDILRAFGMIRRCDAGRFRLHIVLTFFESVLPLVSLYVLKLLIDSVTNNIRNDFPDMEGVNMIATVFYVASFCAVFLLNRIVGTLSGVNGDILQQKMVDYITNMLHAKSIELDIAYYDNTDFHDTLHRAQQEASTRPVQILYSSMTFIGSSISIAGTLVLLASASAWVIPVMVVAVIPSFVVRLVKAKRLYAFYRDKTRYRRRTSYLSGLITRGEFAKELRSYSLGEKFSREYVRIRRELVARIINISKRIALYDVASAVVEAAALLLITSILIKGTVEGSYTIGAFVMLFEAFRKGLLYMQNMVKSLANLYDNKLFISNLYEFFNLRANVVSPKEPVHFPKEIESVEFDDIVFSYPGQTKPVFDGFSLKAVRGCITRIEGENGFGKTTLIKLLLRLYDPRKGTVRINGIDIRRFDIDELRHNVSVVFQDCCRFCFTVRDNIEFGDVRNPADEQRLREAARLGCADSIIEKLPKGYDTPLGRQFDGGEELSMGQFQRVAIARMLYSKAQILAFDEPTAWMDVATRAAFMKNLEALSRERVVFLILHQ